MTLPTSKLPFLNCITDVLFIHVPSGNTKIGGFSGFDTCSRSLKIILNYFIKFQVRYAILVLKLFNQ